MIQTEKDLSPFAPFRQGVFRMLWSTGLIANVCIWMSDVSAAWMMTKLTNNPLWVALVQTASMLPVFLLGLPSGALADSLDRKKYLLFTQIWVAVSAALLSLAVFLGWMTPLLLLTLIFVLKTNGLLSPALANETCVVKSAQCRLPHRYAAPG